MCSIPQPGWIPQKHSHLCGDRKSPAWANANHTPIARLRVAEQRTKVVTMYRTIALGQLFHSSGKRLPKFTVRNEHHQHHRDQGRHRNARQPSRSVRITRINKTTPA